MPDAVLLTLAIASNVIGFAWLALSLQTHWQQVMGARALSRRIVVILRIFGSVSLFLSLVICLIADHATMASLVWIMALAAAALIVAFTFTWRPRTFAPLVVCLACAR